MTHEAWLTLSGFLVSLSGMYYAILIALRMAPANPVSWGAWSLIGIAMFVTSKSSFGINAITFGMVNPIVITIVGAVRQFKEAKLPARSEIIGGSIGTIAIAIWIACKYFDAPDEWVLGLSIAGDLFPLYPIVKDAWERPSENAPFAWLLFGVGYGVSAFGQTEWNVFTLALPVYMLVGACILSYPLVMHRIRTRSTALRWVY